jgi:hypothetical protein
MEHTLRKVICNLPILELQSPSILALTGVRSVDRAILTKAFNLWVLRETHNTVYLRWIRMKALRFKYQYFVSSKAKSIVWLHSVATKPPAEGFTKKIYLQMTPAPTHPRSLVLKLK